MTAVTRLERRLSTLERAVVETVAYSDVFDFPLTVEELWRALPVVATSEEVLAALRRLDSLVSGAPPYYTLAGRGSLVATRARRAEASARLMRSAERYGRTIAQLPFVRMVAVTGALAVENSEDGDDVDYLIVTSPGRVWLGRMLTMAVVRLAKLRGVTLCPNYLLAETALVLPERDLYTARELLQMRPVAGPDVYQRMLVANAWCLGLLPNWEPDSPAEGERRNVIQTFAEQILGGRLGDVVERWLLRRKGGELRTQAATSEAVFDETMCKGHFDAHRERLQKALAQRLASMGVEP
jgi:hypothetical protein